MRGQSQARLEVVGSRVRGCQELCFGERRERLDTALRTELGDPQQQQGLEPLGPGRVSEQLPHEGARPRGIATREAGACGGESCCLARLPCEPLMLDAESLSEQREPSRSHLGQHRACFGGPRGRELLSSTPFGNEFGRPSGKRAVGRRLDRELQLAHDRGMMAAVGAPHLDHVARCLIFDERSLVGVQLAARGHIAERLARGHVERRDLFGRGEQRTLIGVGQPRPPQAIQGQLASRRRRDQEGIGRAPDTEQVRVREYREERRHEALECAWRQLIELQPLTEHAVGRQARTHATIEVDGEKVVHTCDPRIARLGDHDAVLPRTVIEQRARVLHVQLDERIVERVLARLVKEPRACDHRRLQLDDVGLPGSARQRRGGGHAGAMPDHERARTGIRHDGRQEAEQHLRQHVTGPRVDLAADAHPRLLRFQVGHDEHGGIDAIAVIEHALRGCERACGIARSGRALELADQVLRAERPVGAERHEQRVPARCAHARGDAGEQQQRGERQGQRPRSADAGQRERDEPGERGKRGCQQDHALHAECRQ